MALPKPPPTRLETLHLLRALLRETTYLPDPVARHHIRRHIVHRFRSHAHPPSNPRKLRSVRPDPNGRPQRFSAPRLAALYRTGQKALSLLRRANIGCLSPLLAVLHHAYGRTGRRRRELLAPLLVPTAPPSYTPLQNYLTGRPPTPVQAALLRTTPPPRFLTLHDANASGDIPPDPHRTPDVLLPLHIAAQYPRLRAVVAAQQHACPPASTRAKLNPRRTVALPERDIWGRPPAVRRVLNKVRHGHAALLDRVLPPLPEAEWHMLSRLATGRWDEVDGDVKALLDRRRRTRVGAEPVDIDAWTLRHLARTDLHAAPAGARLWDAPPSADAHRQRARALLLDHQLGRHHLGYLGTAGPERDAHHLTPRLMRRLWTRVWAQCCRLHEDSNTGAVTVEWGPKDPWRAARPAEDKDEEPLPPAEWFEGVDELGKRPVSEAEIAAAEAQRETKRAEKAARAAAHRREQLVLAAEAAAEATASPAAGVGAGAASMLRRPLSSSEATSAAGTTRHQRAAKPPAPPPPPPKNHHARRRERAQKLVQQWSDGGGITGLKGPNASKASKGLKASKGSKGSKGGRAGVSDKKGEGIVRRV